MTTSVAVQARGLTKHFGATTAVEGLDLTIPRGMIYGFLGPNGAGKTTTLRMLLGLVRPSQGHMRVLDSSPGTADGLARTGALIEGPAFYPFLSGYDNLRLCARYAHVAAERVDHVLELVGLTDRGADRYRTYSMGMKQRLGVAAALLKDPELVVLDEPSNGLDPAGMRDMGRLIGELGQAGRTVILSSHQLGEVQDLCERVAVIDHGRLVTESSVHALRGAGELVIRAAPAATAKDVVDRMCGQVRVDGDVLRIQADDHDTAAIVRALVTAGVDVLEVRHQERDLHDVFFHVTSGEGVTGRSEDA